MSWCKSDLDRALHEHGCLSELDDSVSGVEISRGGRSRS
jgi:hypothetical protein